MELEIRGPEVPDETLDESPLSRYIVGMLAPFGTEIAQEDLDEESTNGGSEDDDSGATDSSVSMSGAINPSSIGLSFLVEKATLNLSASVDWGDYHPLAREEIDPAVDENGIDVLVEDADDAKPTILRPRRGRMQWKREPCAPPPLQIELKPGGGLRSIIIPSHPDVVIEHLSRRIGERIAVSVFLVNRRSRGTQSRPPVDQWMFQPHLTIRSTGAPATFLPRELEPSLAHSDRDRESNRLLFRNRLEFAVGHGCAVEWESGARPDRADQLETDLIPTYELPRVDAHEIEDAGLDMQTLATVESADALWIALNPLLAGYDRWINDQKPVVDELNSDLRQVARMHLDECAFALARMRAGVATLASNDAALAAFRFANEAMLLQRANSVWARARRHDPINAPPEAVLTGRWRPFQMAFFLLNVVGLVDPTSPDRGVGDLLWFPTGGGKTEAYLGLAAFTMALRRRRVIPGMRGDAGMSVLMRYTLRLLTIQQFQRAATLVCACEIIRTRDSNLWGERPFSIGLWLGMKGTPNSHDESRKSLMRVREDPSSEGSNPCALESCPWCGESLSPDDYWIDSEARRTRVACRRASCAFSKARRKHGVPIVVVDEEIYRECPPMLIATVDKFAQMPWNGDVQSLFGFVTRECDSCGFLTDATQHVTSHRRRSGTKQAGSVRSTERLAPPDLIIQDELHLISGPLGTLVGLYETAVNFLCRREENGATIVPKVIASTATVRRAFEQVQAVFERHVRVFPPPGLAPEDSFFALEQTVTDAAPSRLYVGICAPGKSMKTAYIRVAACLLASGAGLTKHPALADPYLTLVSYYNSLRELGGAIRLMDDDIPARLQQLRTAGYPRRNRPVYIELTSRVRQEVIPTLLRRLEQRHASPRNGNDPLPLDAVLASNMISVGVDVDRLGLMSVSGQPKTTAEYIQATSRVGRQPSGPGLVAIIYNWSRPRDLSHYERFRHYHATLYRNVEAVSATPFSSRALDRGLRGAYVAMTRLGSDVLSSELGASRFDPRAREAASIIDEFRRRVERVVDLATADDVKAALKGLGDEWWGYRGHPLRYGWRSPDASKTPAEDVLLRVAGSGVIGHWPTPQSLREVEESSPIRVLGIDA